MFYYFKKGKDATETHTAQKICAVCGEGAVTDWNVKGGLQSLVLEIPCWTTLRGQTDQLKSVAIKSKC